jgi:hypothetical protein
MRTAPLIAFLASLILCAHARAATYAVGPDTPTGLEIVRDGARALQISLSCWGPEYKWFEYPGPAKTDPAGVRSVQQSASISGTTATLNLDYRARQSAPDKIELAYSLLASDPTEFVGVACVLRPAKGTTVTATFEDDSKEDVNWSQSGAIAKRVRRLDLTSAGETYSVTLDAPRVIETFSGEIRLWLAKGSIAGKTPTPTTVTLSFPTKTKLYPRETDSAATDITPDWFPYPVAMSGTPVDLSFLNKDASGKFVPAGSHGFLTVKGDDFAFADGTPARFWGVNVTAYAAMASYQRSAQLADRIARLGCNVVRLHHLDSDWGPNIINKEHPDGTTQHLDLPDMRKLDRLVHELKQRGIYVIMDPWVGRSFRPGDNVPGSDKFKEGNFGLHPYAFFDPRIQELTRKFLRDFWNHKNEFTGLAYKDEPAVISTECANEALFDLPNPMPEPYRTTFLRKYHDWCAKNNETPSPGDDVIRLNYPLQHQRFFQSLMRDFYADTRAFFKKDLGLKIPVNDSNWFHWPWIIGSQAGGDFMDSHHYYHGNRIGPSATMGGLWVQNPLNNPDTPFAKISAMAILGKPVTSSECGDNPPQTYRSSYYLGLAAVASLQGWDAITPYAYSQSPEPHGRLNEFEMESDPATVASIAAGALIYRRGDVQPAKKLAVMLLPKEEQYAMHWENDYEKAYDHTPHFRAMAETHRLAVVYDDKLPDGVTADVTMTPDSSHNYKHPDTQLLSDTQELWRDWSRGVGLINTPRTQAAYGLLSQTPVSTADASFHITTPFAAISLSSLTDAPIKSSPHLLLTAVARAQDANQTYNLSRTAIATKGKGPVLCEPVTGTLTFSTTSPTLTARPHLPNGILGPPIPLTVKDGKATLELKPSHKTLFYTLAEK